MKSNIPVICLQRLPVYLNYLKTLKDTSCISSGAIAKALGMGEVLVRKDLAYTSAQGRTRVGYNVQELIAALEDFLGCNDKKNAALFGVGGLGKALLAYGGFKNYGIDIAVAFDNDEQKIGTDVCGKPVLGIKEACRGIEEFNVKLAIICVPAGSAQKVADVICGCGVKAMLNFAPTLLRVPDGFIVTNMDVAANLAVLSSQI